MYSHGKNLTVDERLVLFKGRLSFQQYIKSKSARFGIGLFKLCTLNGIPLDFIVYHGNMAPSLIAMYEGTLVTEKSPSIPMHQYLHKVPIFIDNYYATMSLAQYFIEMAPMSHQQQQKKISYIAQRSHLNRGGALYYNHSDMFIVK